MGNCCGSQANSEDSRYPTAAAIPRPQKSSTAKPKAHGPGRTLGSGPSEAPSITPDAKASAALAAEVRLYLIYISVVFG
jgi:hypothetical protein